MVEKAWGQSLTMKQRIARSYLRRNSVYSYIQGIFSSIQMYYMQRLYYSFMYKCSTISHFSQLKSRYPNSAQLQSFIGNRFKISFYYYSVRKQASKDCLIIYPVFPPFQKSPEQMLRHQAIIFISQWYYGLILSKERRAQSNDLQANNIFVTQMAISSQSQKHCSIQFFNSSRHFQTIYSLINFRFMLFMSSSYYALSCFIKFNTYLLNGCCCSLNLSKIRHFTRYAPEVFLIMIELLISLKATIQQPIFNYRIAFEYRILKVHYSESFTASRMHSLPFQYYYISMNMIAVQYWAIEQLCSAGLDQIISKVEDRIQLLSALHSSPLLKTDAIAIFIKMLILQRIGSTGSLPYFQKYKSIDQLHFMRAYSGSSAQRRRKTQHRHLLYLTLDYFPK